MTLGPGTPLLGSVSLGHLDHQGVAQTKQSLPFAGGTDDCDMQIEPAGLDPNQVADFTGAAISGKPVD